MSKSKLISLATFVALVSFMLLMGNQTRDEITAETQGVISAYHAELAKY